MPQLINLLRELRMMTSPTQTRSIKLISRGDGAVLLGMGEASGSK